MIIGLGMCAETLEQQLRKRWREKGRTGTEKDGEWRVCFQRGGLGEKGKEGSEV